MLNRQCRFTGQTDWHSYGNVGFFAAIKQHCADHADQIGLLKVDCRCESEPGNVATYNVEGTIDWRITNPRLGAD